MFGSIGEDTIRYYAILYSILNRATYILFPPKRV